jgi:hypothetical protein
MNSSSFGKKHQFHGRGQKSKQINFLVERSFFGHFKPLYSIPTCSTFYIGLCEYRRHLINCKWKIWVINHPLNTFIMTESPGRFKERSVTTVKAGRTKNKYETSCRNCLGRKKYRFMVFWYSQEKIFGTILHTILEVLQPG